MKKLFLLAGILLILGCKIVETNNENRGLIVPVYFYNLSEWDKVADADADEIAIINPSNGPGNDVDDNYVQFIDKLVSNGKKPVGYVYTKWGARDIDEVEDDIDTWLGFYPNIKGFFIDEVTADANGLDYYKRLTDYIRSKGDYYIVLNPGTTPNPAYFDIADNVVVYENNATSLVSNPCESYSDKSSIIVYGADENRMEEILNNYHCRYVYVTDDNQPNPYDSLPTYFDREIELLK